ncbi:MAG: ABC transporter ATP-binding protein [Candidatus Margulisiibacteriota bacterium]|jgi:ABC-type lipoprotein export system ATPase subunit
MSNQFIIRTENLTKNYIKNQNLIKVIKSVNLMLKRGAITVISGESGSGKSTLLYLISGLLKPCEGNVFFDDQNLYTMKENVRANFINQKIGYVFQDYQLLSNLNVLDNVLLPAMLRAVEKKVNVNFIAKAKDLLVQFNLIHRMTHYPLELSGGEQQRVAILRALINEPEIVFCDEPTGSLDSKNGELFLAVAAKLKVEFNTTFVIVSHSARLIQTADEHFTLKDGEILREL